MLDALEDIDEKQLRAIYSDIIWFLKDSDKSFCPFGMDSREQQNQMTGFNNDDDWIADYVDRFGVELNLFDGA